MAIRTLARTGQLLGLVTGMATAVVLGAAPASAEVPSNDTSATATVITELPFAEVVDTTEATTDEEDAALNAQCGAPATNGSVWYTVPAGTAPAIVVDVSKSDFTAGVMIATGTPGSLSVIACGPDAVGFETSPGETYYVMAFSDTPDVPGGQLSFTVRESGPAPKVSMTVNDVGTANASGTATISGTYTCVGEADLVVLQGSLQQQQADNAQVRGDFEVTDLTCDGTADWSAEVTADSGTFVKGRAATLALTAGCNAIGCNVYETLEVVRLRAGA
ncbi:DUF6299 family protein [Actinophytocola oryzae]|uniref:DUF6299 family protein n=1 Tax=Actinophytocola oryzae TaxID=502181 RepID=UPI0010637E37|nr:DUF6299 family protein [Actinophytocola oryzae]